MNLILQCLYESPNSSGVTAVKLVGNRVVAARLSGFLDFLVLESYSRGRPIDWGFTAYRRSMYLSCFSCLKPFIIDALLTMLFRREDS